MSQPSFKEDLDEFKSISDQASRLLDVLANSDRPVNMELWPKLSDKDKSQGSTEQIVRPTIKPLPAFGIALVFIIGLAIIPLFISAVHRRDNLARQQAAREQVARERAAREKMVRDRLEARGKELVGLGWYKISNDLYFRWCNSGSSQQVKGEASCAAYQGNTPFYSTIELYCIGDSCGGQVVGAVYPQDSDHIAETIDAGWISLGREDRSVVYFPARNNGITYLQRAGNYCMGSDKGALAPCRDSS